MHFLFFICKIQHWENILGRPWPIANNAEVFFLHPICRLSEEAVLKNDGKEINSHMTRVVEIQPPLGPL